MNRKCDNFGSPTHAGGRRARGKLSFAAAALATLMLALNLAGCGKRPEGRDVTAKPAPEVATTPKNFSYGDWSAWQLDCARRSADLAAPCAAVRKRICQVTDTREGVACEHCGGQCREEIADDKGSPLHFYAAWSEWRSNCGACDAVPKPCKAERSRTCVDRVAGRATDCEFCGGACKEEEDRVSGCSPDCKWTEVSSYSDKACTIENKDDIFAGSWGPQTNTPFNAGCSETQPNDKCVNFGKNYYKWTRCTPGCTPPFKK